MSQKRRLKLTIGIRLSNRANQDKICPRRRCRQDNPPTRRDPIPDLIPPPDLRRNPPTDSLSIERAPQVHWPAGLPFWPLDHASRERPLARKGPGTGADMIGAAFAFSRAPLEGSGGEPLGPAVFTLFQRAFPSRFSRAGSRIRPGQAAPPGEGSGSTRGRLLASLRFRAPFPGIWNTAARS